MLWSRAIVVLRSGRTPTEKRIVMAYEACFTCAEPHRFRRGNDATNAAARVDATGRNRRSRTVVELARVRDHPRTACLPDLDDVVPDAVISHIRQCNERMVNHFTTSTSH